MWFRKNKVCETEGHMAGELYYILTSGRAFRVVCKRCTTPIYHIENVTDCNKIINIDDKGKLMVTLEK